MTDDSLKAHVGDWMQTHTGKRFYPLSTPVEDIDFDDISHALSNICRFGGHTKTFYSVAQHSVIVHDRIENLGFGEHVCCAALLHDAAEAYLNDHVNPLKQHTYYLVDQSHFHIKAIEHDITTAIFGLAGINPSPDEMGHIHVADRTVCAAERRDLLAVEVEWGFPLPDPEPIPTIRPLTPSAAKAAFRRVLARYLDF